jgi:plastocyanin
MRRFLSVAVMCLAVACGGGDGGTTGPGPGGGVASVTLSPAQAQIDTLFALGLTVQLTATAKDASGSAVSGATITYATSPTGIISVTQAGVAMAVGNGSATVTASAGGFSDSRIIRVRQKLVTLDVNPATAAVPPGRVLSISAAPRDSRGNAIAGLNPVTFVSSAPTVVSVNGLGTATAANLGTATITATVTSPDGTRNGVSTITVTNQFTLAATVNLLDASFSPDITDILVGGRVTFTNASGVTHNVTFQTAPENSIPEFVSGSVQRLFPTAGSFGFLCTLHGGMTGTIVVH